MDEATVDTPRLPPVVRLARLIGLAGAGFLVVLAVWLNAIAVDHPWRQGTVNLIAIYAIAMLSFLGGIRWALAFNAGDGDPEASRSLLLGALPVVVAPAFFFIPVPAIFAVLAASFAALGAWDSFAAHAGSAPAWYGRLRVQLTTVVVAALILAVFATG